MGFPLQYSWAFLVAQLVKNLPAMWETWVQSLGWEDPLEKSKAILAWRIPWTKPMGSQRVRHNQVTFTSLDFIRTLSHLAFFWELRAVSSWYYFPTPVTCPKLFTAYILYRCPMVTIKRHKQKVPASYHKLLFCILCLGIRQSNQGSPDSGGACSCI